MGVWSRPYEEWLIVKVDICSKEAKTRKQTDRLNIPEYFAALMEK